MQNYEKKHKKHLTILIYKYKIFMDVEKISIKMHIFSKQTNTINRISKEKGDLKK